MLLAALAAVVAAVAGTPQQGQKLTAPATPGATYQWYRCAADVSHCNSISGAKAASYALGVKDVGKTIAVTAKTADASSYLPAVGPVASKAATLVSKTQPHVTGTPTAGTPLAVDNGTWSTAPSGYTYAWLRCNANGRICVAIGGATQATYTPTADDVGHQLAARVTATAGAVAQSALSLASGPIAAPSGPVASVAPSLSGTLQQGKKLTLAPGTWTGNGTVSLGQQWYRCDANVAHCVSIHGATGTGYTTGAKDVGKTLTVTVKATDSATSVSSFVSAVGPVAAKATALVSTAQPKITTAGTKLTVDNGAWSAGAATFTYRWLRCNANGRACAAITGATQQSYTRTADDTGHALVAAVTTSGVSALSLRG
jgi:hypothetical protein